MENSFELMQLPKRARAGQFFNLNICAKERLLDDVLDSIRRKCKLSPNFVILVMDEYASKLISSFCNMFDLMEKGNVYQIEKLNLDRKRYPMSDVIYLVEPVQASINRIIDDFPEVDRFSYDQYGDVHLCFLTTVPDEQIAQMTKQPKFVNKIKTFYEVNLDFTVWQDNIFKIQTKTTSLTKLINPDKSSKAIVEQLSHKLFSLCSVMNERPYIQFQGDSILCEEVALNVYKKLEYLYNYSCSADGREQIQPREPRGTLLILDRTFDLISPLVHDYHYQSVIYDYLKVPESGVLDKIIPKEQSNDQRQAASEQSKKLNEEDMIWQKYKALHIAETFGYLQDEIKTLRQDQANMKKLANKEELHHDDIQKILKSIPEFEKRKAQVLIHLDLAQKVTDKMQNPKMNIMKLIEFEQSIISGVSDQGQQLSENFIAKELTKIIKTLGRAEDKLRLLSIYLLCYSLPDADFKTLISLVETMEEKNLLKLVRDYNRQEPTKKPKRTFPQLSNSEYNEYKRKYVNEIQEMYDILRTQPTIVKLAKDALSRQLDVRNYPFVGDEKLIDSQRNNNAKWARLDKNSDFDERLIITVIGGLSHYEICCLQNLDRNNGSSNLILGSTQIITAKDFIENLVPQRKMKGQDSDNENEKIVIDEDDEEAQREIEKVKQKRQQQKQKKNQPTQKNLQKKNRNNDDSDNGNEDLNSDVDSEDEKQKKHQKNKLANKSIKTSLDTSSYNKSKVSGGVTSKKAKQYDRDAIDLEDVQIQDNNDLSDNDIGNRKNKGGKAKGGRNAGKSNDRNNNRKKTKDSEDDDDDDSDVKSKYKNAKDKKRAKQETDSEDDEEKQMKQTKNKKKR